MTKSELNIDNSGNNQGIIVGQNKGNIIYNIEQAKKIPSLISTVVKTLGTICGEYEDVDISEDFIQYKLDKKIEYNSVGSYKYLIKSYSAYYDICNSHLNTYDNFNMRGKAKILRCINSWYLMAKGEVIAENKNTGKSDIEIIRENADTIIEKVTRKIYNIIINEGELENTCIEDIELGIDCFTCFCFIECKILEKPI